LSKHHRWVAIMSSRAIPVFSIYTDADNTSTFDPSWTFLSGGGPMTIDWGDGSAPESHATGLSHTYAAGSGRHKTTFTCPDWSKLNEFYIQYDLCRLALPPLSQLTGTTILALSRNQFAGNLPSVENCVEMNYFDVGVNYLTGTIPDLSKMTKLTACFLWYNPFTGYTVGSFTTQRNLDTIWLDSCGLSRADVDNVLHDLVISRGISGRVACTLKLDYGYPNIAPNDSPSAAGLADMATLVSAGWDIVYNKRPWIAALGDSITVGGEWLAPVSQSVKLSDGTNYTNWNVAGSGQGINGQMAIQAGKIYKSDIIFIFLGTNDGNLGSAAMIAKIEAGITTLKTNNPGATIYYINILPRWTDNTGSVEVDRSVTRAAIVTACTNQSITCWDTYTTPWITVGDTVDGLHPNAGGYTKIANEIISRLP